MWGLKDKWIIPKNVVVSPNTILQQRFNWFKSLIYSVLLFKNFPINYWFVYLKLHYNVVVVIFAAKTILYFSGLFCCCCVLFLFRLVLFWHNSDLNIIPVESAFPHDQQVSLRVWRAESLFTEGQEGSGAGQVDQCRDSICHSIWLLVKKHCPRWEVRWSHDLWCGYIFRYVNCCNQWEQ